MSAAPSAKRLLGQVLVDAGLLSEVQLTVALERQALTGQPLGHVLTRLGYVSAAAMANALAEQYGEPVRTEFGIGTGLAGRLGAAAAEQPVQLLESPAPADQTPEPVETKEPEDPTAELVEEKLSLIRERNALAARVSELELEVAAAAEAVEHERALRAEMADDYEAAKRHRDALAARVSELELEVAAAAQAVEHERALRAEVVEDHEAAKRRRDELVRELAARTAERDEAVQALDAARAADPAPAQATAHVLLVPTDGGYRLLEREGPPPPAGTTVDLGERGTFEVARVGASPLPNSAAPCAYLLRR